MQRFREWCQRSSTGTLSVDRPVPSNDDDDSDRLVRPFPWHTNIVHLVYHYIIWDPSVLLASKW